MLAKRLIKSNDAGGGACTNTVDLYNPFPDGGGVALYQLNGDATDVSGNYDATTVNAITWGGAGEFGTSAAFNGSSSYITLGTGVIPVDSSYSISMWVYVNSETNINNLLSQWQSGATNRLVFLITTAGKLSFGTAIGGAANTRTSTNYTVPLNQWQHIVVTRNGTSLKFYANGSEIPTTLEIGSDNVWDLKNYTTQLGTYGNLQNSSILDGSIDQVRIFNRALRPYEVEALYTEEYCTPTIVPSEHFNTVLYTGNDADTGYTRQITGVGFQPDFVWIKDRDNGAFEHALFDSVRGAGADKILSSDTTSAEGWTTAAPFSSFDSDGFSVQPRSPYNANNLINKNGEDFVAWNFKAAGYANTFNVLENGVTTTGATAASVGISTTGANMTLTSASVNKDAGFSIVTSTGGSSYPEWIAHGLGVIPDLVITKQRNNNEVWVINIGPGVIDSNNWKGAAFTTGTLSVDSRQMTSTVVPLTYSPQTQSFISYAFKSVEGFSNFGSYVGTGQSSGNVVVTGFEPAFIIIKRTDTSGYDWNMFDNKRDTTNPNEKYLEANTSDAEDNGRGVNFLTNGFELFGNSQSVNGSGGSYIYMAFAADPTTIEPSLEDSFNTVLYNGNGGSQSITGVGFQPDFSWIKNRNNTQSNRLYDSVRGVGLQLSSNQTAVEGDSGGLISFDSDGFSLDNWASVNTNGYTYVSWNWKGAELPAINSNGSIPSVVSANPAAGFSIVSYTGNGANATIGHGLSDAPKIMFIKSIDSTTNWVAAQTTLGVARHLNTSDALLTSSYNAYFSSNPTASLINITSNSTINTLNNKHIAYCFAEVAGFSKFGSYTGTGSAGQKITTGFEPAFVMLKKSSSAGAWIMLDNKRDTTNPNTARLYANASDAETNPSFGINILSDGFDFNAGSYNDNAATYIYMAFANQF